MRQVLPYIPDPLPLSLVNHLRDWQAYLESEDIDPLVKSAVLHAQFELIHPFRDGNGRKALRILALYDQSKREVQEITRSQYTMIGTDVLFHEPLFRAADFVASTGMPKNTAMTILRKLRSAGLLEEREAGRGRKSGILRFEALLEITQS